MANLSDANLSYADLSGVYLRGANLSNARGVTAKQLQQEAQQVGNAFEDVTLPNGQKYEDWIKDKEGRKEDGENG